MSLADYKRLDVCVLGFVRKLMRGTATSKTVTDSGRYKSNGGGWACLRLRSNFGLLALVSVNVCQRIRIVARAFIAALAGSPLSHMIPSPMESYASTRILGLSR